jgi:hypothetical protein
MLLRGWKISEKYTTLLRELWLPLSADISYATDLNSSGADNKGNAGEWFRGLKLLPAGWKPVMEEPHIFLLLLE